MTGNGGGCRIVLPSDFGGHLHTSITLCVPYALRMQPYAVRMHFFGSRKKPMKSRAELTSEKPYALYAPLFGVGPFSGLFLLGQLHTVHKSVYGNDANPALALPPVGIETFSARQNQKCIRIFADFRRKHPPVELIRLCLPSSLADAPAAFCPCTPSLAPLTGLRPFRQWVGST